MSGRFPPAWAQALSSMPQLIPGENVKDASQDWAIVQNGQAAKDNTAAIAESRKLIDDLRLDVAAFKGETHLEGAGLGILNAVVLILNRRKKEPESE